MTHPLVNFLAFQLGWFAACLGAAQGWPIFGPIYSCLWLSLHLRSLGNAWGLELRLLLLAALLGYFADSLLVVCGLLAFPEQAMLGAPSPVWMVVLWVNLAATLRHCLKWLRGMPPIIAAVLGAVAGPFSYFAGAKLGAVVLTQPPLSLAAIAMEWALATPALIGLTLWLESRAKAEVLPTIGN